MHRLKNRIAIITGAARGIGRVTARRFAEEGAAVALWDIDEPAGRALAEELVQAGHQAEFYRVDTTDLDACEGAARRVINDLGGLHILVNNAGITRDSSFKKMSAEQWQQVIDVNLTGVFNSTKAVFLHLSEAGYGRILNASSVVGLYGNFGQTNYAATKAGLIGMTKTWAREFGRRGITVNAVAPGFIATEMTEAMPEGVLKSMRERTPLQRLGQPEDIANAYLFLASEEAGFITGACLSVDGGLVL
ncbi:3-oxoacyl-[acyl-carrier protein] reductase [Lewinella aquimaris]|uniref:3-oxoacyl-[acyl-carrier-protein] reductase n=1 Tax=Neolewinella aquimaris TaxID=1835722 RepID=A0A840E846_9BACT|nr:3-oxoacyl-ACP reductase FabG [Neolewinella aquimaris]MBB4079892.1 3-oxoacyl-[acyl-carrier protein] reductase [Neolewinella aquimaris]